MTRRHLNKRAARLASDLRWELVHAAGCTFTGRERRAARELFDEGYCGRWYRDEAERLGVRVRRVSVPRSLRPLLGRWIGGAE